MRWRRIPPVVSPIAARSLLRAAWGALRRRRPDALSASVAEAFGARECLLTDSGTSALTLALRLAAPPGADVAVPAYVCIDVTAAAQRAGVRLMLYDMHPDTLSPDVESVRRALRRGARAVVVAPLFGYPPDMRQLMSVAKEHGVPLIEDAAQGAGGRVGGARLGSFGDISILSFGRGKGMTTGAGGALLLRGDRTPEWAVRARADLRPPPGSASIIGALAAQWLLARPRLYGVPASIPMLKLGEMVYRPASEPRAITAAALAVLPAALAMNDREVRRRQEIASEITAVLGSRFRAVCSPPDARPGYLRLALLQMAGESRGEPHLGITRGYPVTLDEHPETRRILSAGQPGVRGARMIRDRLVTLPTHSRVSERDVRRLVDWVGPAAG